MLNYMNLVNINTPINFDKTTKQIQLFSENYNKQIYNKNLYLVKHNKFKLKQSQYFYYKYLLFDCYLV